MEYEVGQHIGNIHTGAITTIEEKALVSIGNRVRSVYILSNGDGALYSGDDLNVHWELITEDYLNSNVVQRHILGIMNDDDWEKRRGLKGTVIAVDEWESLKQQEKIRKLKKKLSRIRRTARKVQEYVPIKLLNKIFGDPVEKAEM